MFLAYMFLPFMLLLFFFYVVCHYLVFVFLVEYMLVFHVLVKGKISLFLLTIDIDLTQSIYFTTQSTIYSSSSSGGVIMDVINVEQAKIAEEAGIYLCLTLNKLLKTISMSRF